MAKPTFPVNCSVTVTCGFTESGWNVPHMGLRERVGVWLIIVAVVGLTVGTFVTWTRPVDRSRSGWQLINDHHEPCGLLTCSESNFYDTNSGFLITGVVTLVDAALLVAVIVLCTGTPFGTRRIRRLPLLKGDLGPTAGWVAWALVLLSAFLGLLSLSAASDVGEVGQGLILVLVSIGIALVGIPLAIVVSY